MKVALAQIDTTVGDIRGNCELVIAGAERASRLGADLVVFPELCLTGYPPRDLLGLSGFVDANLASLDQIAVRTAETAVIVGFVGRSGQEKGKDLVNAAGFLHRGRVAAVLAKTLLPTYDVFDEGRYFDESHETIVTNLRGYRLGISVCEDAWNSEEFWPKRQYETDPIANQVGAGANFLVNISASPYETQKPGFRYRMLLEHVRRHHVPLVYVNLVGGNDDLLFDGNSFALSTKGRVLAQCAAFREDFALVEDFTGEGSEYRDGDPIGNLFEALTMGTRDYARKCGFRTAVLGLSGGVDSAVTACIATAALGHKNVLGVSMPSIFSAPESRDDAELLARNLGIRFEVVPVAPIVRAYHDALAPVFHGREPDTTEENIQARIRGNILMALSNKFGHLVLSTGNKSELGVGYCTLYGDMAGGLAVISDVPKTSVYALARYINRNGEVIPSNTLTRPPSAELKPDQTDQDTLPDYGVLDGILQLMVERQLDAREIENRGFDREVVEEVFRMLQRSEYKRRQAAPGLKVSGRAFGTGWRMPVAMKLRY